MVMGRPRKAGATRPERRIPKKELQPVDGAKIPDMPDSQEWVQADEWCQPVIDWWKSAFSSPMSSEFTDSDVHGLYLGCMYLHESLNPNHRVADRLKFGNAWESTIKNYGLTPHSRENLKWAISQGTSAEKRTEEIRATKKTKASPKKVSENDPQGKIISLYDQFR